MRQILFINCSSKNSGAEISLLELINKLNKEKFCVHLILPEKNDISSYLSPDFLTELIPLNRTRRKDLIKIKEWIKLFRSSYAIVKYAKRLGIDIVYCNTSKALPYCFLIKYITSIKIICHCRDVERSALMRFFINVISDKIICVSDFIRQKLQSPVHKTTVCYNCIDTAKVTLKRCVCYTLAIDKTFTIANIGQAIQWKRQDLFLDIAASIIKARPEVHFLLVIYEMAKEDQSYLEHICKRIYQLGLESYFTVTGFQKDIYQLLSSVDLLIHTANNEPFGRIVAEALAMEVPVIASAQGGTSEIIVDNQNGFLIDNSDVDVFAEKAIYLMRNLSISIQFGINGRRTIEEKFNSAVQTRKIEAILNSI
jgi:glycosyltransferase involved in cell wall biosynthesis